MPASTRSAANRAMKATASSSPSGTSTPSAEEHGRDLPHVAALVEVRRVLDLLPLQLLPPEVDGPPERLDLPARVVHVILARRRGSPTLPSMLREHVAHGRAPAVPYVERSRRVGAHELQDDLFPAAHVGEERVEAGLQHPGQLRPERAVGHVKVDEALLRPRSPRCKG